jgi:hypothetical protein
LFIGEVGRRLEPPEAIVHARRSSAEEQGRCSENHARSQAERSKDGVRIAGVVENNARDACR